MARIQSSKPGEQGRWPAVFADPQVRVAIVTAVALLAQAVIAKNVLDVKLDFFSQFAAFWVFIVFEVAGVRSRTVELLTSLVIVLVAVGVLLVAA